MTGSLLIPNVGAGDVELTFDRHDAEDRDKALKILKDMQQRGYAILVRLPDETYVRAERIDLNRGSYVLRLPEDAPVPEAAEVPAPGTCGCGCGATIAPGKTYVRGHHRRGKAHPKRGKAYHVPVTKARAAGIARSAGG